MRSLFVLAMLSAHGVMAAENEPPQVTPQLRQRAEDLAGAASKRFSDILDDEQRVAQAQPDTPSTQRGTFAPVWEWLARSSQAYDEVVIAQLKNKDGWTVVVQRNGEAAPPAGQTPAQLAQAEPQRELRGWNGLVEMVRDWLARANRTYRNEIVKPLLEPTQPGAPSELVEQPPAAPAPMAPPSGPEIAKDDQAAERIKRQAQSADTERAINETEAKGKAEDDIRLAAQAEAKRKADEQKRLAGDTETKGKADESKRVADEAAAKRKADESSRIADEAAAKRKTDEAKRVADEAAAKRKAEDAKRIADAATADAAEHKAVAEAEAATKRQAEIDAEATRRSEAAARTKQAARAEASSPSPPTPQIPQQKAEAPAAAPAPANTPTVPLAKTPRAAESPSPPPASSADEHSDVAVAPSVPEPKPTAPAPTREATPKAREEAVTAEPSPPVVSKKKPARRAAYASRPGKKHASSYRRKGSFAYAKHRKPRYAQAHSRKHRAYGADVVYAERRCDCRCGRVFGPRKRRHAAWHSYASPRVYSGRSYRVRPLKHRRGLTYRHGRHYIR
jgi:hypothetical protein